MTPTVFTWLGRFEGVSLLVLLFIAMPMKYMGGDPLPVRWVGSLHGGLFLIYVSAALYLAIDLRWPWKRIIACLILSSVPFGTFYFERKIWPGEIEQRV